MSSWKLYFPVPFPSLPWNSKSEFLLFFFKISTPVKIIAMRQGWLWLSFIRITLEHISLEMTSTIRITSTFRSSCPQKKINHYWLWPDNSFRYAYFLQSRSTSQKTSHWSIFALICVVFCFLLEVLFGGILDWGLEENLCAIEI